MNNTTTTSNSCNSSSSSEMTPVSPPPGFHGTSFAGRIGQRDVHFLVIRMTDTFFLWVGDDSKTLHELAVAMPPPPLAPPQPPSVGPPRPQGSATTLIGVDALSQNIAVKLAKKTGCQVFVSVSLKSVDKETEFELQKRILEELTVNPDAFLTKPPPPPTTAATMTRMMENTTIT